MIALPQLLSPTQITLSPSSPSQSSQHLSIIKSPTKHHIQSPKTTKTLPTHTILEEFDIIREVLRLIPLKTLLTLRSVNRLWNRICSEIIFQHLNLNKQFVCYQDIKFNQFILNQGNRKLFSFLNYKNFITQVTLDGPITLEIWEILKLFKNIRKFKINRCSNIEEINFKEVNLNNHWSKLTTLSIEYCQYHFSMPLPLHSPALFQVSGLKSLTLIRTPTGMQDQVQTLILNNPQLQSLHIKLHRFEIETMSVICSKLAQLRQFTFLPFKNSILLTPVEDDKVVEFGNWCGCKNQINFYNFNYYKYGFKLNWSSLLAKLFENNQNLEDLKLGDVYLNTDSLNRLGELKKLKKLRINNCKVNSEELKKSFQAINKLENCELSMVEGINNDVITSLVQFNQSLKSLKLEWVKVTHFGIESIRKFCNSLQYLELNLRSNFYLKQFEFNWNCSTKLKTLLLDNIHSCSEDQLGLGQFKNLKVLGLRAKENSNALKSKLSDELKNTKIY